MDRGSGAGRDRHGGMQLRCGARLDVHARPPPSAPRRRPPRPPTATTTGAVAGTLTITAFDLGFKPASLTVPAAGRYEVKLRQHRLHRPRRHVRRRHEDRRRRGRDRRPARSTSRRPGSRSCARSPGTRRPGCRARSPSPAGRPAHGGACPAWPTTPRPGRRRERRRRRPRSPTRTPPRTPSATRGADGSSPARSTTSTSRSSRRTSRSPRASSSTPGPSAARSPGPTIRVHLGDTVNVHLTNRGSMSHSIDFHASQTAMNHQMVEIKPGESFTYTFTADYAGVWMYHCGTAPALHHIANGMFGMVIVEPKGGLPKVDDEFAFVQSEWYLGAQGEPADYAKANQTAAGARLRRVQRHRQPVQGPPDPGRRPRGGSGSSSSTPGRRSTARSTSSGTIFDTSTKEGIGAPARQRGRLGLAGRRPRPGPGRDHRVHARSRTGCTPSSPTRSTW